MKNKKLTKKSKWLKLALISTAGLTTLAAVPAMVCAKNITKVNSAVATSEDPILNVASYVEIMFKLSSADIAGGATITGKTVVKVKKGNPFGTVVKPTASKFGWTFKYWQYEKPDGSKIEMQENTPCNHTGNVTAVFEQDKGNVVVEGKEIVSLTDTATYTASILPSTAPQKVDWYVADNLDNPYGGSSKAEINKVDNKGVLKAGRITTGSNQPVYVFAVPENTTPTITAGSPNIKEVKLVSPWEHPDYAQYVITENDSGDYFCVEQSEFTDAEGNLTGTPLGGTDPVDLGLKTEFNDKIYIGNEITNIDNNFLADFTSFDNVIRLNNVVQIGSNFLSGATSYSIDLDLSNKVTYVGDCFMEGCASFNGFVTFGDKIAHIGDNFMEGCSAFAQTLTLPESLTEIGNNFLYECNNFSTIEINCSISSFEGSDGSFAGTTEHTISALCHGKATFDSLITLFPNKTGYIKRNLVNPSYAIDGDTNYELYFDKLGDSEVSTKLSHSDKIYMVRNQDGYPEEISKWSIDSVNATGVAKALLYNGDQEDAHIRFIHDPTETWGSYTWQLAVDPVDTSSWSAERKALLNSNEGDLPVTATLQNGLEISTVIKVKKPITLEWIQKQGAYDGISWSEEDSATSAGKEIKFNDFSFTFGFTSSDFVSTKTKFSGYPTDSSWLINAVNLGLVDRIEDSSTGTFTFKNNPNGKTLDGEQLNTWHNWFQDEQGNRKPSTAEFALYNQATDNDGATINVPDPFAYYDYQTSTRHWYEFTANWVD